MTLGWMEGLWNVNRSGRRSTKTNKDKNICGTNGKSYANICEFLENTCHPNDRTMDNVFPMTSPNTQNCKTSVRRRIKKVVNCYVDIKTGNMYSHQDCEIRIQRCQSASEMVFRIFLHPGRCGECTIDNICPWKNVLHAFILRNGTTNCTSNGLPYNRCCTYMTKCYAFRKN